MTKSVTEPISRAYERTVQMLFKPFEIGKWFVLGFAVGVPAAGQRAINAAVSLPGTVV